MFKAISGSFNVFVTKRKVTSIRVYFTTKVEFGTLVIPLWGTFDVLVYVVLVSISAFVSKLV